MYKNPLDAVLVCENYRYRVINQGFSTDRTLNNLHRKNSPFFGKPILESFGLCTYMDKCLYNALNELIEDIISYYALPVPDTICSIEETGLKMYTKKFECYIDNDWIDTLNIYVTFDYDHKIFQYVENNYMTLAKRSVEYVEDDNGGLTLRENFFKIKDIDKPRKHKIETIRNKRYTEASVLIVIHEAEMIDRNKTDLDYILKHELEHLYYRLINEITNVRDNSDVIENIFEIKEPVLIHKYQSMVDRLNDIDTTDKERIEIIRSMNKQAFEVYIYDILYLLNKSELHARVADFVKEIKTVEKLRSYKDFLNGPYRINKYLYALCRISDIFNIYYNYYHNFELFIKYLPDNTKQEFAENEIKLLYNKKRSHKIKDLPERPYDFDFAETGIYNEKTFDAFFNYQRQSIKHCFIKPAVQVTVDFYCL